MYIFIVVCKKSFFILKELYVFCIYTIYTYVNMRYKMLKLGKSKECMTLYAFLLNYFEKCFMEYLV